MLSKSSSKSMPKPTHNTNKSIPTSNKIGFWAVFSIVTGSQIGSGVFTLPPCLAPYGVLGLFGCLLAGLGAMALCYVFASLCSRLPKTGGPHVYVQHAFGPKIAFFSGWTYWVISWISTTAVIVTSVGYLSAFLDSLFGHNINFINNSQAIYLLLEIGLLFCITLLNLKGVKVAGNAEFFLAILKFIPLLILPIAALSYFNWQNFTIDPQVAHLSHSSMLGKTTLFALWGFIGLETATTPADSVINPSVTIPRAIIGGTLSVALLYILNFVGIMGLIPGPQLMNSNAAYVDAAQYIFGGNWHLLVSIIASIICIGTLNAWILTSGQIALGLSIDGLMPKFFSIKNKGDAPVYGIIISCVGIVPLLILTSTSSLSEQITKIIDISVIAFLFVYFICAISFLKLLIKEKNKSIGVYLIATIALIFCGWIIYETPIRTLLFSSLFTLSGIPVYLCWYCRKGLSK